jgi:hypothetical protein
MLVRFGRFLQLLGMVILPAALLVGTVGDNVRAEVNLLGVGGALFVIGWLIARSPDE